MYLARSFPLIKPASFHLPTGYVPFDAAAPPKRCRVLASMGPYDSGACSTAKTRRTKSLAPYCHHYHHHHPDAFAGRTPRTNMLNEQHLRPKRPSRRTSTIRITPPAKAAVEKNIVASTPRPK